MPGWCYLCTAALHRTGDSRRGSKPVKFLQAMLDEAVPLCSRLGTLYPLPGSGKGSMNTASKNPPQSSPAIQGSAEHVLRCVHTITLLAESSASTRSDLYRAALALKGLNEKGMEALLADLQGRLADPALRSVPLSSQRSASPEQSASLPATQSAASTLQSFIELASPGSLAARTPSKSPDRSGRPGWFQRLFGTLRAPKPVSFLPEAPAAQNHEAGPASPATVASPDSVPDQAEPSAPNPKSSLSSRSGEAHAPEDSPAILNLPASRHAEAEVPSHPQGTPSATSGDVSAVGLPPSAARPEPVQASASISAQPSSAATDPELPTGTVPVFPQESSSPQPVVPAPFTTGRWDSGRRARLAGQSRFDPKPPTPAFGPWSPPERPAERRTGSQGRGSLGPQDDLVRSIPATGWIPGTPVPPSLPHPGVSSESAPLTRRWELLSRFDSGSRPAARPEPKAPGPQNKR